MTAVAMGYSEVEEGRRGGVVEEWRVGGGGAGGPLGQISAAFHTSAATGCHHIIKYGKYLEVTHLELLRSCVCVCACMNVCVYASVRFKNGKKKKNEIALKIWTSRLAHCQFSQAATG